MGGGANESLKSLKAAALNAQDAAFRYQFQTSGFQQARNSSKSNTSVELGPSPIELCHTSVADAGKATEVQTEKETAVPGDLFQIKSQTPGFHQQRSIAKGSRSQYRLDKISEGLIMSTMSSHRDDGTSKLSAESRKYAAFFKKNIYPLLSQSASIHEAQFLKTDLFEITMELTKRMFTPGWKSLVRDGCYKLDNEQMDNLRQYIENHYLQKALQSQIIDLTSTDPEDDVGNLPGKSVALAINAERSNGVHPTPSQPSPSNILDDISFLGPGQMPQPPEPSRFNIDLSMLGPGEVFDPSNSALLPQFSRCQASLTEKLREKATLLSNRRSKTPEKPTKRFSQPKQEESEEESSPDSTERKRLLSTWLSPSRKPFSSVATSSRKRSSSFADIVQRTSAPSPAIAKRPPNSSRKPEPKLFSSLAKVETENGVDSGSAQQWVSSLFTKSDPKPSSKGRLSLRKMPPKASSSVRRGPYRKSGRLTQQVNNDGPPPQQLGDGPYGIRSKTSLTALGIQKRPFQTLVCRRETAALSNSSLIQGIACLASGHDRPYLGAAHDMIDPSEDHNDVSHIDFTREEIEELLRSALSVFGSQELGDEKADTASPQSQLRSIVTGAGDSKITEMIHLVHDDKYNVLRSRNSDSIKRFLADLVEGLISVRPGYLKVAIQNVDPIDDLRLSTSSLLRCRELGTDFTLGRHVRSELRLRASGRISPWRRWKGASGDVVACAWAPNSKHFAIGATATSNNEDLQYNRPRNLLIGDLASNVINELPDHRVDRPRPNTIPGGPNANEAMYNSLDPMIYTTISSLHFSHNGSRLITGSHDKKVKVWDVSSSGAATCARTMEHNAIVTNVDISKTHDGLIATAAQCIHKSIRIYHSDSAGMEYSSFSSPRAEKKKQLELYPECLRWGKTPNTSHVLLAGFQQWASNESKDGDICLWDVDKEDFIAMSPTRFSVFTAAWHPLYDIFAVGGAPPTGSTLTHHTTRSVVRTFDMRALKRFAIEFECPAVDMQDVTFHPIDQNIVTAGCTDAATYVWDYRKPTDYIVKLQHERPLTDWDHTKCQEDADAGVMMTVWGLDSARFYTGSSDGIIKCWNPFRAPEDALIRNVADLGANVQSGAFSPDFTQLLVGDSDGGVHILSSAPYNHWAASTDPSSDTTEMELVEACGASGPREADFDAGNEGILEARRLLRTGQLVLDEKYGVGKGPNYAGPYAMYARLGGFDLSSERFIPEYESIQAFNIHGKERHSVVRTMEGMIRGRKLLIAESRSSSSTPSVVPHPGRVRKFMSKKRARSPEGLSLPVAKRAKIETIDLTLLPLAISPKEVIELSDDESVEDNFIPDSEYLAENHWWPKMDQDVLARLQKSKF